MYEVNNNNFNAIYKEGTLFSAGNIASQYNKENITQDNIKHYLFISYLDILCSRYLTTSIAIFYFFKACLQDINICSQGMNLLSQVSSIS